MERAKDGGGGEGGGEWVRRKGEIETEVWGWVNNDKDGEGEGWSGAKKRRGRRGEKEE